VRFGTAVHFGNVIFLNCAKLNIPVACFQMDHLIVSVM